MPRKMITKSSYNLVIPPVSPTPSDVEITSKAAPHESADDSSKLSKIVAQLASLQKDFIELAHKKWMNSSQSEQKHAAFAVSPVPQSGGPHILKIIIHKKYVGGVIKCMFDSFSAIIPRFHIRLTDTLCDLTSRFFYLVHSIPRDSQEEHSSLYRISGMGLDKSNS